MRRRKLVGTVVTPASLGNFQLTIWRYDIGDSLTRCASQMFGTSKAKSTRGFTCAWVFLYGKGFVLDAFGEGF